MLSQAVMISSTMHDLPEHRKEVLDACLRQKMLPLMMEHLPASPADAIRESLRLVEEASVYLAIIGHRYGYVPQGHPVSVTEMEYDFAVQRGLPRLVFLMHEDHLVRAADVDKGEAALKLRAFRERLQREQVVAFFHSPVDLRAHVINSLSHLRRPDLQGMHFVSDIPSPPEPYVAHPYTLLQAQALVGRQSELNLLTDWVAGKESEVYAARILVLVALGGMGKSAVTWKWFQEIAPQEMIPLSGRLWWSFYESDATFENFVIRALAYVKGISRAEAQALSAGEREEQLLNLLDRYPYLLVLDGLERILIAYARMDAPRMADDDLDERSENFVVGSSGLLDSTEVAFRSRHRLRKTFDPRAGNFLRKLSSIRASRILVSTRLYPAELQNDTGREVPGAKAVFLLGLTDDDCLILWRSFGVTGSREVLQSLFRSFGNYPLLIRALAGEVAQFRPAPGNFQEWLRLHPDFNPFELPLVQRKSHVLSFALRGLAPNTRKVLVTLAAFRMPAAYDTLVSLLVGPGRVLINEAQLDAELSELEDRGLLGWDRRANRYDLHPVVRGVTWHSLGRIGQRIIYENLQSHFESLPSLGQDEVNSLDDLATAIELFYSLIGLENYEAAFDLFTRHLDQPTLVRLSFCRESAEWLEAFFPKGVDQPPALAQLDRQTSVIVKLAYSHHYNGNLELATRLWQRALTSNSLSQADKAGALESIAVSLLPTGSIYNAEVAARQALQICITRQLVPAEAVAKLGYIFSVRGLATEAEAMMQCALIIFADYPQKNEHEVYLRRRLANHLMRIGNLSQALEMAESALCLAQTQKLERPLIVASNTLGDIFLAGGDSKRAAMHFVYALTKARSISYVQEEIASLVGLARTWRAEGDHARAMECLEDASEPIERGSFRLHRAAALIARAELEHAAGNFQRAVNAAVAAYSAAWCDGPPYANYWELESAKSLLAELDTDPPPNLPPFEANPREPQPKIDLERFLHIQTTRKRL